MTEPVGPEVALARRDVRIIVAGLMVGTFLSSLDILIVVTALPTIVGELGGRENLGWVITSYLLASTACSPVFGKLGDTYGRKRVYQVSIAIFIAGSIVCGLSQSMLVLIGGRVIQGVGGAGLRALPLAMIGDVVPVRDRARYQSVMTVNILLATVAGPLVGGFFVDNVSWRWIFLINVPLGALGLLAASPLRIPLRAAVRTALDLPGSLLIVGAATTALLLLSWGGDTHPWGSPTIVALGAITVLLVAALVWWERQATDPVLPAELFTNRTFVITAATGLLLSIPMQGAWSLIPIFLQVVTGASATTSGLLLLPFMVALTAGAMLTGRAVSQFGRYKIFPVVGQLVATVGFASYALMGTGTTQRWASLAMTLTGLGLGMTLQVTMVMAQAACRPDQIGVVTAALTFFRNIGQSFGVAIAVSIFNSRLTAEVASRIPGAVRSAIPAEALEGSPTAIAALPQATATALVDAFARALHSGFLWIVPPAIAASVLLLLVDEVRAGAPVDDGVQSTAAAVETDPVEAAQLAPSGPPSHPTA